MNSTKIIHEIVNEFGQEDKPRLMRRLLALKTQLHAEQKRKVTRIVKMLNQV
jgi:hypothetical protein